jgi:hypothetical protein
MIIKINPEIIPYDTLIRLLCLTPHHGHSHGCPNYNIKDGCPPKMLINAVFDFSKEMYLIYTTFSVGQFAERMRMAHPEWKESNYPDWSQTAIDYRNAIMKRLASEHHEWPDTYFPKNIEGEWKSSRNWYNPRRWQESSRKIHRDELEKFINQHPDLKTNSFPEAHGINLTGLMYNIGIELPWQWPPVHNIKNESYTISVAGHSINNQL